MENMLGKVVRKLVENPNVVGIICDFLEKLCGKDGQSWQKQFSRFLRKMPSWSKVLLEWRGNFIFHLGPEWFEADKYFVVRKDQEVKISVITDRFKEHFSGKKENPSSGSHLALHSLKDEARDLEVIFDLGGETNAETLLAEMYDFVRRQGNGQYDVLAVDGRTNIFFVRDIYGDLVKACCRWEDGWRFDSTHVGESYKLKTDTMIFSQVVPS